MRVKKKKKNVLQVSSPVPGALWPYTPALPAPPPPIDVPALSNYAPDREPQPQAGIEVALGDCFTQQGHPIM